MQMRVVRLNVRNPFVAAAVLLIVLAAILLVLGLGVTLLAAAAVVGGVGLLARRVLRLRRPAPPRIAPLDPSREVFAEPAPRREALPPAGES
jgi:hypothetical protein